MMINNGWLGRLQDFHLGVGEILEISTQTGIELHGPRTSKLNHSPGSGLSKSSSANFGGFSGFA